MAIRVAKPPRLPSEYQEVEYIQSTGTQIIHTGVVPSVNTEIIANAQLGSDENWICGIIGTFGFGRTYVVFGNKASSISLDYSSKHNFKLNKTAIYQDETSAYSTSGASWSTTSLELYLFGTNYNGANYAMTSAKIYNCNIYDNGTLLRNFIPCYRKSDSVIGLYDLVNGVFYTNSGTGTFLMGRPINALPQGYQEVEYIQSTGTQYIDTGYKPNTSTRIKISFLDATYSSSGNNLFFSASDGTWSNQIGFLVNLNAKLYIYWHTDTYTDISAQTSGEYYIENGKIYYNGSLIYTVSSYTAYQSTYNMYLFSQNWGGTSRSNTSAKWKSIDIWDGTTLVRSFIPCIQLSNNEVGMYDIVNGQFYGNGSGTGVFTAGANVGYYHNINPVMFGSPNPEYRNLPSGYTQVEWLKTTTKQLINTGITDHTLVWKLTLEGYGSHGTEYILGYGNQGQAYICYQGYYSADTSKTSYTINTKCDLICTTNLATISLTIGSQTVSRTTSDTSNPVNLFAYPSSVQGLSAICYGDITAEDTNGTIQYRFVPCVENTGLLRKGYYEVIHNVFYPNVYVSSTEDFIAGNVVPRYTGLNIKKVMLGTADGVGRRIYPREFYLYDNGDECTSVTGGWSVDGWSFNSSYITQGFNTTQNGIYVYPATNSSYVRMIGTQRKINLSNYTKLYINYNFSATNAQGLQIDILDVKQTSQEGTSTFTITQTGEKTLSFDISSINAEKYIAFHEWYSSSYSATGHIKKIWLEK